MRIYIFYPCIYTTNILYMYIIYTHILKGKQLTDVYGPLHMYIFNDSSPEIMTAQ